MKRSFFRSFFGPFFFFTIALGAAGCAGSDESSTGDSDDADEAAAIAEEQDLTTSEAWKCTGDIDHTNGRSNNTQLKKVRAAAHPEGGYDRFVMEFAKGGFPDMYLIHRQAEPVFYGPGEGEGSRFKVKGDDGLEVIFMGERGDFTPHGPDRIAVAGGKGILEAAEYEDFEANVSWGLGTKKNACVRSFTLANPPRLVVDVQR